jgi:hypothetical protein
MTSHCSDRQGILCRSCPKNRGSFRQLPVIYGTTYYKKGINPLSTTISWAFAQSAPVRSNGYLLKSTLDRANPPDRKFFATIFRNRPEFAAPARRSIPRSPEFAELRPTPMPWHPQPDPTRTRRTPTLNTPLATGDLPPSPIATRNPYIAEPSAQRSSPARRVDI